jgi:hypothetical protein
LVIHAPQDPYGDGYVLTAATELHDDGLTAMTIAGIEGVIANRVVTLPSFMDGIAADWRGREGVRAWQSMESRLAGGHSEVGHAAWSARAVFVLEAGKEMTRLAADLTHFLRRK